MRLFAISIFILWTVASLQAQNPIVFEDPRDGQEYNVIKIKVYKDEAYVDRFWFGENLRYKTKTSVCYRGYDVFCESLGRLYNWYEAKDACPSGWHITTFTDWHEMTKSFGGLNKAGKSIQKSPMSIEMSGFGEPTGEFYDVGIGAYFWDDEARILGTAGSINVLSDSEKILHQRVFGYHLNSVRCVKNY